MRRSRGLAEALTGEPVYRTSVASPNYSDQFDATIQSWLLERFTRQSRKRKHERQCVTGLGDLGMVNQAGIELKQCDLALCHT